MFEVPPSSIIVEGNKVTVPSTQESREIYDNYCTSLNAYKFSAPKIIGTKYGIMLRRFKDLSQHARIREKVDKKTAKAVYEYNVQIPFIVDRTGLGGEKTKTKTKTQESPIRFVKPVEMEEGEIEE